MSYIQLFSEMELYSFNIGYMHYVQHTRTRTLSKTIQTTETRSRPNPIFPGRSYYFELQSLKGPYIALKCCLRFLIPASESEVFLLLEEQREADDGRVYQQTAEDGHGRCAACDFRRVP
jgi:hypothetical protein